MAMPFAHPYQQADADLRDYLDQELEDTNARISRVIDATDTDIQNLEDHLEEDIDLLAERLSDLELAVKDLNRGSPAASEPRLSQSQRVVLALDVLRLESSLGNFGIQATSRAVILDALA